MKDEAQVILNQMPMNMGIIKEELEAELHTFGGERAQQGRSVGRSQGQKAT
jgi:hypothetical protein